MTFTITQKINKIQRIQIISKDFERPWGGFLVIDEIKWNFSNQFFKGLDVKL